MAMNIVSPLDSPSFEPTMTTPPATTATATATSTDTISSTATTTTPSTTSDTTTMAPAAPATGGLRRNNTLKAYLANKNKIKERQAINVIVDPNILKESADEHDAPAYKRASPTVSDSSDSDVASPRSPSQLMSPVSGKRIDTDLEALDRQKKVIEEQLASITQQLNQQEGAQSTAIAAGSETSTTGATNTTSHLSKSQLLEEKSRLCEQLDQLMKQRRELLQSWARDYKNLKRSGSLAKRQEDLFWVTTA
ncbi:hypothetical protein BGZ94_006189 [Podila epigama]|nr:hypothetical protein BGZ94_006189 [Podila epigama]